MTPSLLSECEEETGDGFSSVEDTDERRPSPQLVRRLMLKQLQLYNEHMATVYSSISTDRVKMEVQQHLGEESNHISPLTYGDIDANSFANMLIRCSPQKGETFVDLGRHDSSMISLFFIKMRRLRHRSSSGGCIIALWRCL